MKLLIRTIFFDFGNVLAFFDHGRAIEQLVKFTHLNANELISLYEQSLVHDYETGKITTKEFVREAMLHGKFTCTADEYLTHFCDIFWRNPEVCDLIPRLKPRYRLVLASNTVDAHFRKYVTDFADVFHHFNHLVASHHAGARKPHPKFFEYAHQFALARPDECLFVDDLAANIETAERFGWKGVVYAPDGTLAEKLKAAGIEFGTT